MANIPGLSAESLTAMFNAVGKPYVECAFMTKHDGLYYLQYACPGTQYNTYADGVYTSNSPLGPFMRQASNPFSAKPGRVHNRCRPRQHHCRQLRQLVAHFHHAHFRQL